MGGGREGGILVDEVGLFGVVDMDFVWADVFGLPVGGEDYYGGGLDFLGDFLADGLEDGVDGVGGVVLDVGLHHCQLFRLNEGVAMRLTPPWLKKYTGAFGILGGCEIVVVDETDGVVERVDRGAVVGVLK